MCAFLLAHFGMESECEAVQTWFTNMTGIVPCTLTPQMARVVCREQCGNVSKRVGPKLEVTLFFLVPKTSALKSQFLQPRHGPPRNGPPLPTRRAPPDLGREVAVMLGEAAIASASDRRGFCSKQAAKETRTPGVTRVTRVTRLFDFVSSVRVLFLFLGKGGGGGNRGQPIFFGGFLGEQRRIPEAGNST